MRADAGVWARTSLLALGLGVVSRLLLGAALMPLTRACRALSGGSGEPQATAASDLVTFLTAVCAALLLLAWVWVVAAVSVCLLDALRRAHAQEPGSAPLGARPATFLRPPLVRALVAGCLGVTAVAAPVAALARTPDDAALAGRAGHLGGSTAGVTVRATLSTPLRARLLHGLPVPDRPAGRLRTSGPRPGDVLQVRPGDTLWSLVAGLLPADAPAVDVAAAWPLLYAANRAVIGDRPDVLHPGQTLRVSPALADAVRDRSRPVSPLPSPLLPARDAGGPS